ncbi:MAG TPA: hypothetical protein VFM54_20055 [Micromonosporaceae bacterium]|nr:hypothetical protein [Micromonosporaceae bacterium]
MSARVPRQRTGSGGWPDRRRAGNSHTPGGGKKGGGCVVVLLALGATQLVSSAIGGAS